MKSNAKASGTSSPDMGGGDNERSSRRKISVSLTRPSDSETNDSKSTVAASSVCEEEMNHKNLLSVSAVMTHRRKSSSGSSNKSIKRHSGCSVRSENLSLSNMSSGIREANSSVRLSQELNDVDLGLLFISPFIMGSDQYDVR